MSVFEKRICKICKEEKIYTSSQLKADRDISDFYYQKRDCKICLGIKRNEKNKLIESIEEKSDSSNEIEIKSKVVISKPSIIKQIDSQLPKEVNLFNPSYEINLETINKKFETIDEELAFINRILKLSDSVDKELLDTNERIRELQDKDIKKNRKIEKQDKEIKERFTNIENMMADTTENEQRIFKKLNEKDKEIKNLKDQIEQMKLQINRLLDLRTV